MIVKFKHHDASHALQLGQTFSQGVKPGFSDTAKSELVEITAEVTAGRPWREAVSSRYEKSKPWLHRIVADTKRTAFFKTVLPEGDGPVLDIGAGWGQISRPLARHRPVVALEPVAERLSFIEAAAKQDKVHHRIAYLGVDYLETAFETKFAAICAIGVLEWVGAFQKTAKPQQRQRDFLRKAKHDLAKGGALIVGIENRLGLKYLMGCPDDHIGVPHIACLPAELAARRWHETSRHTLRSFTYSQSELTDLLKEAGFAKIEFFAAFPDYKLPESIIPMTGNEAPLNAQLLRNPVPAEHNGYDGTPLDDAFQEALQAQYRSLAAEGIADRFVPSFFVRAR